MRIESVGGGEGSVGVVARVAAPTVETSAPVLLLGVGGLLLLVQLGLVAAVYESSSYPFINDIILSEVRPIIRPWGTWSMDYAASGVFIVRCVHFLVVAIPAFAFEVARRASGRPRRDAVTAARVVFWALPFLTVGLIHGDDLVYCLDHGSSFVACILP